ncbi:MAG: NAD(P)H-binding protein [Gemmatimonadaceae bacterium]
MKVLLFGATGMVGDGVLHECLEDSRIASVLAVTRSALSITHAKLREIRRKDFFDYRDLSRELEEVDACFFCLGVSSVGMSERDYHHQTYELTMSAATAVAAAHPNATFCYVTGEGTDSSERGKRMWARVKGKTENALLALPLDAYMFRPGFIRPRPGARSKTRWYRLTYAILNPLYPVLSRLAPKHMTTSENVAHAMLAVADVGYEKRVLENWDINALASADRARRIS